MKKPRCDADAFRMVGAFDNTTCRVDRGRYLLLFRKYLMP